MRTRPKVAHVHELLRVRQGNLPPHRIHDCFLPRLHVCNVVSLGLDTEWVNTDLVGAPQWMELNQRTTFWIRQSSTKKNFEMFH